MASLPTYDRSRALRAAERVRANKSQADVPEAGSPAAASVSAPAAASKGRRASLDARLKASATTRDSAGELKSLRSKVAAQDAELQALRAQLDRQTAREAQLQAELDEIHCSGLSTHGRAQGETKGIDVMNQALWKMGALKHAPPSFRYFDPTLDEQRSTLMKEIKLPRAQQTHELCYEPLTRCLFISQMSNSVLVRIPVGPDGMLADDQDAWTVGPLHPTTGEGVSGLHNISRSWANPGCLWLSLQFANVLLLLDAATMGVRQVIRCPQLLTRADGSMVRIGGPHCVRECGQTGSIWVALKGSVPCHPQQQGSGSKSLAAAVGRVCCNPQAIRERMAFLEAAAVLRSQGEGAGGGDGGGSGGGPSEAELAELAEGYAVWRLKPARYDPAIKPAFGGTLFECEPSPPMVAIAADCNCYVPQDNTPAYARIDTRADTIEQVPIPLPDSNTLPMTGPAIATAPDGAIWCSLLGGDASLLRIDAVTGQKSRYELGLGSGEWMRSCRFIHLAFHKASRWLMFPPVNGWKVVDRSAHLLYLISSNLVDDTAINAITVITFVSGVGTGWTCMLQRKDFALPTQDCCCHRIELITDDHIPVEKETAVVSELSSSRVFQIQLQHLMTSPDFLHEKWHLETCEASGESIVVYSYTPMIGIGAKAAISRGVNAVADSLNSSKESPSYWTALFEYCATYPPLADGSIVLPMRREHLEPSFPAAAIPAAEKIETITAVIEKRHLGWKQEVERGVQNGMQNGTLKKQESITTGQSIRDHAEVARVTSAM